MKKTAVEVRHYNRRGERIDITTGENSERIRTRAARIIKRRLK